MRTCEEIPNNKVINVDVEQVAEYKDEPTSCFRTMGTSLGNIVCLAE